MDTQEYNGTFWLSISAMILLTFVGTLTAYCLKSKCKNCNVSFGLVQVERDIQAEVEEEKLQIEHGINPYNLEHKN